MRVFIGLSALALGALSAAQTVVPNIYTATEGSSSFIMMNDTLRRHQVIISASQLTGMVGHNIQGMQFRMNGGVGNWPSSGFTLSTFSVRMGASVAPNAVTSTYDNNFVGSPTQVRTGSLTINAGSWTGGPGPNPWGQLISFDTPYFYNGGNLAFEMTISAMPFNNNGFAFDAADATSPGHMTDYSAAWGTSWTSTAGIFGANARVPVTRFTSQAVPEPATLALLGAGFAGLLARRRRAH